MNISNGNISRSCIGKRNKNKKSSSNENIFNSASEKYSDRILLDNYEFEQDISGISRRRRRSMATSGDVSGRRHTLRRSSTGVTSNRIPHTEGNSASSSDLEEDRRFGFNQTGLSSEPTSESSIPNVNVVREEITESDVFPRDISNSHELQIMDEGSHTAVSKIPESSSVASSSSPHSKTSKFHQAPPVLVTQENRWGQFNTRDLEAQSFQASASAIVNAATMYAQRIALIEEDDDNDSTSTHESQSATSSDDMSRRISTTSGCPTAERGELNMGYRSMSLKLHESDVSKLLKKTSNTRQESSSSVANDDPDGEGNVCFDLERGKMILQRLEAMSNKQNSNPQSLDASTNIRSMKVPSPQSSHLIEERRFGKGTDDDDGHLVAEHTKDHEFHPNNFEVDTITTNDDMMVQSRKEISDLTVFPEDDEKYTKIAPMTTITSIHNNSDGSDIDLDSKNQKAQNSKAPNFVVDEASLSRTPERGQWNHRSSVLPEYKTKSKIFQNDIESEDSDNSESAESQSSDIKHTLSLLSRSRLLRQSRKIEKHGYETFQSSEGSNSSKRSDSSIKSDEHVELDSNKDDYCASKALSLLARRSTFMDCSLPSGIIGNSYDAFADDDDSDESELLPHRKSNESEESQKSVVHESYNAFASDDDQVSEQLQSNDSESDQSSAINEYLGLDDLHDENSLHNEYERSESNQIEEKESKSLSLNSAVSCSIFADVDVRVAEKDCLSDYDNENDGICEENDCLANDVCTSDGSSSQHSEKELNIARNDENLLTKNATIDKNRYNNFITNNSEIGTQIKEACIVGSRSKMLDQIAGAIDVEGEDLSDVQSQLYSDNALDDNYGKIEDKSTKGTGNCTPFVSKQNEISMEDETVYNAYNSDTSEESLHEKLQYNAFITSSQDDDDDDEDEYYSRVEYDNVQATVKTQDACAPFREEEIKKIDHSRKEKDICDSIPDTDNNCEYEPKHNNPFASSSNNGSRHSLHSCSDKSFDRQRFELRKPKSSQSASKDTININTDSYNGSKSNNDGGDQRSLADSQTPYLYRNSINNFKPLTATSTNHAELRRPNPSQPASKNNESASRSDNDEVHQRSLADSQTPYLYRNSINNFKPLTATSTNHAELRRPNPSQPASKNNESASHSDNDRGDKRSLADSQTPYLYRNSIDNFKPFVTTRTSSNKGRNSDSSISNDGEKETSSIGSTKSFYRSNNSINIENSSISSASSQNATFDLNNETVSKTVATSSWRHTFFELNSGTSGVGDTSLPSDFTVGHETHHEQSIMDRNFEIQFNCESYNLPLSTIIEESSYASDSCSTFSSKQMAGNSNSSILSASSKRSVSSLPIGVPLINCNALVESESNDPFTSSSNNGSHHSLHSCSDKSFDRQRFELRKPKSSQSASKDTININTDSYNGSKSNNDGGDQRSLADSQTPYLYRNSINNFKPLTATSTNHAELRRPNPSQPASKNNESASRSDNDEAHQRSLADSQTPYLYRNSINNFKPLTATSTNHAELRRPNPSQPASKNNESASRSDNDEVHQRSLADSQTPYLYRNSINNFKPLTATSTNHAELRRPNPSQPASKNNESASHSENDGGDKRSLADSQTPYLYRNSINNFKPLTATSTNHAELRRPNPSQPASKNNESASHSDNDGGDQRSLADSQTPYLYRNSINNFKPLTATSTNHAELRRPNPSQPASKNNESASHSDNDGEKGTSRIDSIKSFYRSSNSINIESSNISPASSQNATFDLNNETVSRAGRNTFSELNSGTSGVGDTPLPSDSTVGHETHHEQSLMDRKFQFIESLGEIQFNCESYNLPLSTIIEESSYATSDSCSSFSSKQMAGNSNSSIVSFFSKRSVSSLSIGVPLIKCNPSLKKVPVAGYNKDEDCTSILSVKEDTIINDASSCSGDEKFASLLGRSLTAFMKSIEISRDPIEADFDHSDDDGSFLSWPSKQSSLELEDHNPIDDDLPSARQNDVLSTLEDERAALDESAEGESHCQRHCNKDQTHTSNVRLTQAPDSSEQREIQTSKNPVYQESRSESISGEDIENRSSHQKKIVMHLLSDHVTDERADVDRHRKESILGTRLTHDGGKEGLSDGKDAGLDSRYCGNTTGSRIVNEILIDDCSRNSILCRQSDTSRSCKGLSDVGISEETLSVSASVASHVNQSDTEGENEDCLSYNNDNNNDHSDIKGGHDDFIPYHSGSESNSPVRNNDFSSHCEDRHNTVPHDTSIASHESDSSVDSRRTALPYSSTIGSKVSASEIYKFDVKDDIEAIRFCEEGPSPKLHTITNDVNVNSDTETFNCNEETSRQTLMMMHTEDLSNVPVTHEPSLSERIHDVIQEEPFIEDSDTVNIARNPQEMGLSENKERMLAPSLEMDQCANSGNAIESTSASIKIERTPSLHEIRSAVIPPRQSGPPKYQPLHLAKDEGGNSSWRGNDNAIFQKKRPTGRQGKVTHGEAELEASQSSSESSVPEPTKSSLFIKDEFDESDKTNSVNDIETGLTFDEPNETNAVNDIETGLPIHPNLEKEPLVSQHKEAFQDEVRSSNAAISTGSNATTPSYVIHHGPRFIRCRKYTSMIAILAILLALTLSVVVLVQRQTSPPLTAKAVDGETIGDPIGPIGDMKFESKIWTEQASIVPVQYLDDRNGYATALSADGTRLVVGGKDYSTNNSTNVKVGIVRIYDLFTTKDQNTQVWKETAFIIGDNSNDQFGAALSLSADGTILVVGSPGHDAFPNEDTNEGKVSVFDISANNSTPWENAISSFLGEDENGQFGLSVSLESQGNDLAIGAPFRNNAIGGVFVYTKDGRGAWYPVGEVLTGTSQYEQFGFSVSIALDGIQLVVGAPGGTVRFPGGYIMVRVFILLFPSTNVVF
eukprot:scaffold2589_cov273-Chaetoceros_neogracile.AAC.16